MISRQDSNWNDILQGRKLAWPIDPYIKQLKIHVHRRVNDSPSDRKRYAVP